MHSKPPVILVHEPRPHWAPLLQWAFVESQELAIRAAPQLVDLEERLRQPGVTGCVLVLGESQHQELLNLVSRHATELDVFILVSALTPEVEWAFREVGAVSVVDSSISVSQYVRILRKRLQSPRHGT